LPSFDVIIDSSWQKWAYYLKIEGKLNAPVLGVCHAPIHTMYQSAPPILHPCLVGISQDQTDHIIEHLGVSARRAYNGIDVEHYKVREGVKRTDRYLFLARMSRIKGPHIAVDLARKLRFGLDLVGDDVITGEPELAQRMRMMAVHNIVYHGGVSREKTVEFFSAAKALLHCNKDFREPFGLAPIEAQATGLPVIAFDNGAMRETIVHGKTGFLVKSIDEMEELIKTDAVSRIKAADCRKNAERFTVAKMVQRYEALCREAIECPW
jgi:glycosyltransferase involved in cell wall biosynthesis